MIAIPGPVPVSDLHRWKTEATQRLLGDTIAITEAEWHRPSLLPGWSRAHVATHLARNADYLRDLLIAAINGRPQPQRPDQAARRHAVELGADRTALELQIDLDASAGALQLAFESVTDWTPAITLCEARMPLSALTLARLHEVASHHLDLGIGFSPDAIEPAAAVWLLKWALARLEDADLPRIELSTPSLVATLGTGEAEPLRVQGSEARSWAWLIGRGNSDLLDGAGTFAPPLLG